MAGNDRPSVEHGSWDETCAGGLGVDFLDHIAVVVEAGTQVRSPDDRLREKEEGGSGELIRFQKSDACATRFSLVSCPVDACHGPRMRLESGVRRCLATRGSLVKTKARSASR